MSFEVHDVPILWGAGPYVTIKYRSNRLKQVGWALSAGLAGTCCFRFRLRRLLVLLAPLPEQPFDAFTLDYLVPTRQL